MFFSSAVITATVSREVNAINWDLPANAGKNDIYLYVPAGFDVEAVTEVVQALTDSVWSEAPDSLRCGVRVSQGAYIDALDIADCRDRRADVIFYLRPNGAIVRNGEVVTPSVPFDFDPPAPLESDPAAAAAAASAHVMFDTSEDPENPEYAESKDDMESKEGPEPR